MVGGRYDLTDVEWSVIEPLLPRKWRGVKRVDDRRVLNGIFLGAALGVRRGAGAPWRDLPERYGPYTTAYNRFNRVAQGRALGPVDGRDHKGLRRQCADDR